MHGASMTGDPEHCLGDWAANGSPFRHGRADPGVKGASSLQLRGKEAIDDQMPEIEASSQRGELQKASQ